MSLLRSTTSLLFASLAAALIAPAGADQVFSTTSTGPVHVYPTQAPYPLGDIYYAPCGGYGNYGGGGHGGRGGHGSTTLTGERFYPYDIGSNGNRIRGGHGSSGNAAGYVYGNSFGMNCSGQGHGTRPSPSPRPVPVPYTTPRAY